MASWARIRGLLWSALRGGVGSPQEWAGVLLVFATLAVAAWSIEQANWIRPQPSLITSLVLAVLAGLVLVRSHLSARIAYPVMVILGLGVTAWQAVGLMPYSETQSALGAWWSAVSEARPSEGTTYFAMFLILVVWIIGFVSTWWVLRRQNAWVAVGLGTLTVLINLSNLPREDYLFLPLYLLVAMLLIGQVNLARQGVWFGRRANDFPYRGVVYLAGVVVCISMLTVATAWFAPQPPVDQMGLGPVAGGLTEEDARGQWYNIFAGVHAKWGQIDSDKQLTLAFGDPLSTSNRVHFIVTADQPAYWRTRRYDTYHSWGWASSELADREITAQESAAKGEATDRGEALTFLVENRLRTDVVLTVGDFVSSSVPVLLQAFPDEKPDAELPPTSSDNSEEVAEDRPKLDEVPEPGDVIAVVTPRLMKPYQRYDVSVSVRTFTPEELSDAGEDYPAEITDRYLQLPGDFPTSIRLLARVITRGAESPYGKVMAVKARINRLAYNVEADVPPEGVDGVEHFLFEAEEGVCTSFASAMAVMLRAVGIPARLNTGYLEGDHDAEAGTYLLRVRDYHARTEVYFPGYGWVEFSATPIGGSTDAVVGVGDADGSEEFLDREMMMTIEGGQMFGGAGGAGTFTPIGSTLPGPQLYVYFFIIGVPVALFLAARGGYAFWMQRLKMVHSPVDAYRKMSRLATLGKIGPMEQETPLEYCDRLAAVLPLQADLISAIVQTYVEALFSPRKELGRLQQARLQRIWVELVPSLARRVPRLRTRPD